MFSVALTALFCPPHSYGMRFIAKVLKDSLHEKFPDAGEDELLKVRAAEGCLGPHPSRSPKRQVRNPALTADLQEVSERQVPVLLQLVLDCEPQNQLSIEGDNSFCSSDRLTMSTKSRKLDFFPESSFL